MNNELLLLIKKHTDTLIEQTKTKPRETLEFEVKKKMEVFSISPSKNLSEEERWLQAVTNSEARNSVFNIFNENNNFSITTPSHWTSGDGEENINKLNKFLELKSENDMEVHVKEVEKRGTRIEIRNSGYN